MIVQEFYKFRIFDRFEESEEFLLYDSVLDAAVDAIIIIDHRGTIERVNRATLQLFGYDEEELLGRMRDHGLAIQPGYQSKYSNYGLSLLGLALARAAGKPYEDLVRARVLEPLGMSGTQIRPSRDMATLATGYEYRVPGQPRKAAPFTDANAFAAAANMAIAAAIETAINSC